MYTVHGSSAPAHLPRFAAEGHLSGEGLRRTRRGFAGLPEVRPWPPPRFTTSRRQRLGLLPASSSGSFGTAFRRGAGGAPSATSAATSRSAAASLPTASNGTSSAASSSAAGRRRRPPSAADASHRRAGSE